VKIEEAKIFFYT